MEHWIGSREAAKTGSNPSDTLNQFVAILNAKEGHIHDCGGVIGKD